MNGMNFKPFIAKVLGSLSDENLVTLAGLMDSHSNSFINRSLINPTYITTSDKGVGLATVQLDQNTIRTGYLVYNNSYCVLLSYNSASERVTEFEIDVAAKTYKVVKEYLTTDYLRHEVAIRSVEAGQVAGYVTEEELKEKAAIVIETNNITGLTNAELDSLKVGDVVQKKTGNDKHCYIVTYKGTGAGTGICLTYVDAGHMETVSYDRSSSGWVYNSTDVVEVPSFPANPSNTGIFTLKMVDGVLTWVADD